MIEVLPASAGVVVDLDDTLYPERSFHESGFRWTARRAALDPSGPEVRAACEALRAGGRPLDILAEATRIPVETLREWHRSHPPEITLYPDARRFIARLAESGVPAVLLTDGRSTTQRNKLEALGIRDAFCSVLISEETGVDKSREEAFLGAARPIACRDPIAYFGDNPAKDVSHPLALGWRVYLIHDRGDNVHPQLIDGSRSGQVNVISSFDSLGIGQPQ